MLITEISVLLRYPRRVPQDALELVAALVAAGSQAHTRRSLVRRVAEVLARWSPLVRVELVDHDPATDELEGIAAEPGDAGPRTPERRPLAGSRVAAALRSASPFDSASGGRGGSWEARALRRIGAARFLIVPLAEAPPASQALIAWLGPADDRPDVLAPPMPALLGRVLSHVLRAQEVTQRVAEVSRRAHAENRELRDQQRQRGPEPTLVAHGPAMAAALARVDAVAGFDTAVLLLGESGTGKELLAQRVHAASSRAHRPWVALNCGALPPQLIESALFGHEAGAFTGATRRHRGVFERAHRGTLFLDEVGELPPAVQVKLLRALQSNEFERVGGEEAVQVDVRVIAATHRELADMVEAGRFRRDLYYRLCVFPIRVPPLRERLEEVPALASALVAEICGRLRIRPPPLTAAVLERLRRHPWPGNVRELRNVLEAALIVGRGEAIDAAALDLHGADARPTTTTPALERLEDATRRCIAAALTATGGRIYGPGGAAEALDLKPGTLQSKMRKLGIQRGDFVPDAADDDDA
ncbi:MAG: sigma-54 dependent transcriptional regulator [Nannocystaceae bacterium]